MEQLQTPFGALVGADDLGYRADQTLETCTLSHHNVLSTPYGPLVPVYDASNQPRRRVQPVRFHPNGMLRSVPLQESVEIQTPLGTLPAELVTFHPSGAVRRVFPLNGKLSGFWRESDEAKLATALTVATPLGPVRGKVISIHFHPCGALRSLTFWPGEVVMLPTPQGRMACRIGVAFWSNGALRSLEPAAPTQVSTGIGTFQAFDPDPEGISGDVNSLCFAPDGEVVAVSTLTEQVVVTERSGAHYHYAPALRQSLCEEEESVPVPLGVTLDDDQVRFAGSCGGVHPLATCQFRTEPYWGDIQSICYRCD